MGGPRVASGVSMFGFANMLGELWVDSGSDHGSFGCTRRRGPHTRGGIPSGGMVKAPPENAGPPRGVWGSPFLQLSEPYSETLFEILSIKKTADDLSSESLFFLFPGKTQRANADLMISIWRLGRTKRPVHKHLVRREGTVGSPQQFRFRSFSVLLLPLQSSSF